MASFLQLRSIFLLALFVTVAKVATEEVSTVQQKTQGPEGEIVDFEAEARELSEPAPSAAPGSSASTGNTNSGSIASMKVGAIALLLVGLSILLNQ